MGFVLPVNNLNGMRITTGNKAKYAAAMEACFYDDNGNEKARSTYVNGVMAQPITKYFPPFCLLLHGSNGKHTAIEVKARWNYITNELKTRNIQVICISSDSDPTYNSIMRKGLSLGINNSLHSVM